MFGGLNTPKGQPTPSCIRKSSLYTTRDSPTDYDKLDRPIFRKPDRFEWEQEFRILRILVEGRRCHNDPEWYGRFERVNLPLPRGSDSDSSQRL